MPYLFYRPEGWTKPPNVRWVHCGKELLTHMPREITWTDTLEIGIQLQELHPETDPYSVRFTDLHKWVTELPGFTGDPNKSSEPLLEAIQTAWHEEYEDAKNG